jgi:hypothetical protein
VQQIRYDLYRFSHRDTFSTITSRRSFERFANSEPGVTDDGEVGGIQFARYATRRGAPNEMRGIAGSCAVEKRGSVVLKCDAVLGSHKSAGLGD